MTISLTLLLSGEWQLSNSVISSMTISLTLLLSYRFSPSSTRTYIIAMSVFDLLFTSLSLPGEILDLRYSYNFNAPWVCRSHRFLIILLTIVSGFILVAVALDRRRKICFPFRPPVTPKRVTLTVLGCLASAFALSVPFGVLNGHHSVVTKNPEVLGSACSVDDAFVHTKFPLVYNCILGVVFVASAGTMIYAYVQIGRKVVRHKKKMQEEGTGVARGLALIAKKEKKAEGEKERNTSSHFDETSTGDKQRVVRQDRTNKASVDSEESKYSSRSPDTGKAGRTRNGGRGNDTRPNTEAEDLNTQPLTSEPNAGNTELPPNPSEAEFKPHHLEPNMGARLNSSNDVNGNHTRQNDDASRKLTQTKVDPDPDRSTKYSEEGVFPPEDGGENKGENCTKRKDTGSNRGGVFRTQSVQEKARELDRAMRALAHAASADMLHTHVTFSYTRARRSASVGDLSPASNHPAAIRKPDVIPHGVITGMTSSGTIPEGQAAAPAGVGREGGEGSTRMPSSDGSNPSASASKSERLHSLLRNTVGRLLSHKTSSGDDVTPVTRTTSTLRRRHTGRRIPLRTTWMMFVLTAIFVISYLPYLTLKVVRAAYSDLEVSSSSNSCSSSSSSSS